jgi:hypothetical protein
LPYREVGRARAIIGAAPVLHDEVVMEGVLVAYELGPEGDLAARVRGADRGTKSSSGTRGRTEARMRSSTHPYKRRTVKPGRISKVRVDRVRVVVVCSVKAASVSRERLQSGGYNGTGKSSVSGRTVAPEVRLESKRRIAKEIVGAVVIRTSVVMI